jgi:hypothetical protein
MKEMTSSYDDIEKRMAIFIGLGALVFCSLYLLIHGADLWTFLIRGVLSLATATIIGWAYGHWVRGIFRQHSGDAAVPENVERQSRDAQAVEGRVIGHSEMPDAVIPAESAAAAAENFMMPDFDAPMLAPPAATKRASLDIADEGDLPPPPVPAGI